MGITEGHLDGTLSKSVEAQNGEEIGAPIHPMVQLVKQWLARGEDVRIFTARVNPNHGQVNASRARRAIEAWCKRHLGQVLPITYEKDWDMGLLFDDRARQVERDTGQVFGGHSREVVHRDKSMYPVVRACQDGRERDK